MKWQTSCPSHRSSSHRFLIARYLSVATRLKEIRNGNESFRRHEKLSTANLKTTNLLTTNLLTWGRQTRWQSTPSPRPDHLVDKLLWLYQLIDKVFPGVWTNWPLFALEAMYTCIKWVAVIMATRENGYNHNGYNQNGYNQNGYTTITKTATPILGT